MSLTLPSAQVFFFVEGKFADDVSVSRVAQLGCFAAFASPQQSGMKTKAAG